MNSSRQDTFRWKELSGLQTFNDPDAPWLVLFHGFGADCNDLASLADLIPTQKKWNFLFPQGPLTVPLGMGWVGRAWWNLDMVKLQTAINQGLDRDTGLETPKELPVVREKVIELLQGLKVPWNRIVLGGFSQGSMLATDISFHLPEKPMGLVILSGGAVNKKDWQGKRGALAGLTYFQSHGSEDQVLTLKNAQRMDGFLRENGLKGKLIQFSGGHEIPSVVLQQLGSYLDSLQRNDQQ